MNQAISYDAFQPAPMPQSSVVRRASRAAAIPLLALVLACAAALIGGCASSANRAGRGVVASDHPVAAEAGAQMLRRGGNAVDAAVAASFALSVVRPESCGIGGGGFMLIHLRNDPRHGTRSVALDYRERAPRAVGPDYFENLPPGASEFTGHAVAVPGTVAGLLHALDRYGSLDRKTVLEPAIRAARQGFAADRELDSASHTLAKTLESSRLGTTEGDTLLRRLYPLPRASTQPDTQHTRAQRIIRNPQQAEALELIAKHGAEVFYSGEIAKAIVATTAKSGGAMTLEDLQTYRITESRPLVGAFRGRKILAMPLPSSGGLTILHILRIIELRADLIARAQPNSPAYLHLLAEAFKSAFSDRAQYLGDPEFTPDPTKALLDDQRLRQRAAAINPREPRPATFYGSFTPIPTDAGTSHICAVDKWGSAVACTETINLAFGSRIAVPEYGFCLNNEMDDFLTRRGVPNAFGLTQSDRNLPAPRKRPLSSMSPTIVLSADGAVDVVAGASGGPYIITATVQAILNAILFNLPAQAAVTNERFHHQWSPDVVSLEAEPLDPAGTIAIESALRSYGHPTRRYDASGVAQIIIRRGARWEGAGDPRKGGAAAYE